MISYQDVPGAAALQVKVRLDKKIVGCIYKAPAGGFYYRPAGGSVTGETFETIAEVKRSLEED